MASTTSNIKDFALAVWSNWFTLLSGPLSVPAAAAAFWVTNETAKIFFGLTAFGCLLFSAYRLWEREHEKVIERDQKKRKLLDEISAHRTELVDYRIQMERDHDGGLFNEAQWKQRYDNLEAKIASKIEQLSSKAEAETFLYRGNISRQARFGREGSFRWPVLIDVCIHDIDYLRTFIHDYSRGRQRT